MSGAARREARIGVYPGSFNPPTIAHLAIAEAACRAGHLDRLDLVVSEQPLGKGAVTVPSLEDRLSVLTALSATRPWLGLRRTTDQLLADIAAGADALVLGADKWAQVQDPAWYGGSASARDAAVARLPLVLVAPRPPFPLPQPVEGRVLILTLASEHEEVSSTAVRTGRREWMAPEAAEFDRSSGAWSEPDRYRSERHQRHDSGG